MVRSAPTPRLKRGAMVKSEPCPTGAQSLMTCLPPPRRAASALFLIAASATLLAGCGDEDTDAPVGDGALTLAFEAVVGDAPFACGQTYEGLGTQSSSLTPIDLRFYVHDVVLLDGDGGEAPLALTADGAWQTEDIALLDFEDGCDNGTAETNARIVGTAPKGDWTGVRFTVGVPPELNDMSLGLEQRVSPLNVSSMFWSWSTGYKFFRIDSNGPFRFHLGSTGCASPDQPFACTNLNFPTVELDLDPTSGAVVIDIAALLTAVDLEQQETPCMSQPDNPNCAPIFGALGLPHGGGDGGAQSAFRAR